MLDDALAVSEGWLEQCRDCPCDCERPLFEPPFGSPRLGHYAQHCKNGFERQLPGTDGRCGDLMSLVLGAASRGEGARIRKSFRR
jgi:hypothetical protein